MSERNRVIIPDWPLPKSVGCMITTRIGGVSRPPFDSFNLGDHVGDAPLSVNHNRMQLEREIQQPVCWLDQVHGTDIVESDRLYAQPSRNTADGVISSTPGQVCAVLTADCLPILVADQRGRQVAAIHAGWRGLAAGIVEKALKRFNVSFDQLSLYIGPSISQSHFEVGEEVFELFLGAWRERLLGDLPNASFLPSVESGKYKANLQIIAKEEALRLGVTAVYGGELCTWRDNEWFYSYRKSMQTGRFASLIWIK